MPRGTALARVREALCPGRCRLPRSRYQARAPFARVRRDRRLRDGESLRESRRERGGAVSREDAGRVELLREALASKMVRPLIDGVPNSGSSLSTKQKQPWIGTSVSRSASAAVTRRTCLASPSTSLVCRGPAIFSVGLPNRGLTTCDLALVALGVDHPHPRRRDRDVVDICPRAGNAAVMQNRKSWVTLRQLRLDELLAAGAAAQLLSCCGASCSARITPPRRG